MYPISNLQQIKKENLQQELVELQNKIDDLERYCHYSEVNELLEESKTILNNEKNSELIAISSKKIDDKIKLLVQPTQEKFSQLIFLMSLIEIYCDQNEIQSLNSVLAIKDKKLRTQIANNPINLKEVENNIAQIDYICHKNLNKILKKIKNVVLEKAWDTRYKGYLDSLLGVLTQSEKEIREEIDKISNCFEIIKFSIKSVKVFEGSHELFLSVIERFNVANEKYLKVTKSLLDSEAINFIKDEIVSQTEVLSKDFVEFDPRVKKIDVLDSSLQWLDKKIDALYQINYNELKNEQIELMKDLSNSKERLAIHAKKLSQSATRCAEHKHKKLELINKKVELLLNPEINQEENVFAMKRIADSIFELKEVINEAKTILSEYRGVYFFRCVAKLWGGGEVKSQLLVNLLEDQLTDLQRNITSLSPDL